MEDPILGYLTDPKLTLSPSEETKDLNFDLFSWIEMNVPSSILNNYPYINASYIACIIEVVQSKLGLSDNLAYEYVDSALRISYYNLISVEGAIKP